MKTFTLKARFICMHILCLLFAVMPQHVKAQWDAMESNYNGTGLSVDTLTAGIGASSTGATRVMLYNEGKKMFLNAAGYWGTRTATFTVGLPLVFERMSGTVGSSNTNHTFRIHGPFGDNTLIAFLPDYSGNGTKYGVFFDRSGNGSFGDETYTPDYGNWEFVKVTEGEYANQNVYQIKVSAYDGELGQQDFYLCAKQPMTVNVFQNGNDNLVKALPLSQNSDVKNSYWKVVSDTEMVQQFENTYTEDGPSDASFLLRAQGFNRNNMYNNKNYGRGWEKDGNFTFRIGFDGLNIGGHQVENYQVDPIFGMFYCADITGGNTGERLYQTVKITRSGWYKIECQGLFNDKDGATEPYAKLYAKFTDAKTENSPEWASCYLLPKSYGEVESRLNSIGYNTETFKSFQDDYGDQHPTYTFLADDINDGKISNKIEAAVAFYKLIYPNAVMIYVNLDETKGEAKTMELGIQVTKDMASDEYIYIDDFRLKYLGASFVLNDDWTDFKRSSNENVSDYTQKYQNNVLILKRSLAKDKWNSICLPVDLTAQQLRETFSSSVKLAKLSDPISEDPNCIEFRLVNLNTAQEKDIVLRAGECYIIKPGEGNYIKNGEIKIGDEANDAVTAPYYVIPRVSLTKSAFATDFLDMTTGSDNFKNIDGLSYKEDGTFERGRIYRVNGTECQLKVYATFENDTPTPAGAYNFFEGNLYHFKSDRNRLKGYNWWIEDIHAGETTPAVHTLSFRASMDGISDNTTTAIEGLTTDIDPHEMPLAVYNVCGQAVRRGTTSLAGLPSGLYVVNGKKIFIK